MTYDGNKKIEQLTEALPNVVTDDTLFVVSNGADALFTKRSSLGLVTAAALVTALSDYLTETEITTLLTDYVTDAELVSALSAYLTESEINTLLGDYYTETEVNTLLSGKVTANASITGATKTKVTYDSKGLVTGGTDATTADIADSTNRRYITDAQKTVIENTSGVNSGDQDLSGYEQLSNKSTSTSLGTSDTLYPSQKAVKTYVDNANIGLLDYRGAYDASVNTYPTASGSGSGGTILKGDMFVLSAAGTLGGAAVQIGDAIIANVDTPGQTSTNWDVLNANVSYVPENVANKENTTIDTSTTKYPTVNLLKTGLDTKLNLNGSNASSDVNIGSYAFIMRTLKADTSAGIALKANDGTDVGLLGAGNTSAATWYGAQTYAAMTERAVPFFGAGGLLSQDATNFTWDNVLKRLSVSSTLGSELITNGTFTGNATGWSVGSGWAYSSNAVVHSSNGTSAIQPSTALTTVLAGYEYQYSVTVSALTVGTVTLSVGGVTIAAFSANGTYTGKLLATSNANLTLTPTNTARLTVDDVSLKRISGGTSIAGSSFGTTFTSVQGALNSTTAAGFVADNPTSATSGQQQASPSFLRRGRLWNSGAGSSQPFEVQDYVIGSSSSSPYGKWFMQHRANNGAWTEFLSYDTNPLGEGLTITPMQSLGNGSPGTTRHMTFNNIGSHTWIDFKFNGVVKSNFGADNSGGFNFWVSGGNYIGFVNKATNSLFSYNYPSAFVHYAQGVFGGSVMAGSNSTPTSTLTVRGGSAFKTNYVKVNTSLDDSATNWIFDASTNSCTGTASTACSSHADQSACEARGSHGGGCTWNPGYPCSWYNGDQSSCESTSGCTWDTADCGGIGDEMSCTSTSGCSWSSTPNDCSSFGDEMSCVGASGCSWYSESTSDCSTFNGDESTCAMTMGCTVNTSYCSWNGSSCDGGGSCSSIGDESTCNSSTYFSSCSGSYVSSPAYCSGTWYSYACTGSYYTGGCSGTFGSGCTGTPSCAGIGNSTDCGNETGCSWTTSLTATLPNGDNYVNRGYWFHKKGASGSVIIVPASGTGQTVNGSSSYTMTSDKEWSHFVYHKETASCSIYSEGSCTGECTPQYNNCSWNSMDVICEGGASCSSYTNEYDCTSASYYTGCTGSYTVFQDWVKMGS